MLAGVRLSRGGHAVHLGLGCRLGGQHPRWGDHQRRLRAAWDCPHSSHSAQSVKWLALPRSVAGVRCVSACSRYLDLASWSGAQGGRRPGPSPPARLPLARASWGGRPHCARRACLHLQRWRVFFRTSQRCSGNVDCACNAALRLPLGGLIGHVQPPMQRPGRPPQCVVAKMNQRILGVSVGRKMFIHSPMSFDFEPRCAKRTPPLSVHGPSFLVAK